VQYALHAAAGSTTRPVDGQCSRHSSAGSAIDIVSALRALKCRLLTASTRHRLAVHVLCCTNDKDRLLYLRQGLHAPAMTFQPRGWQRAWMGPRNSKPGLQAVAMHRPPHCSAAAVPDRRPHAPGVASAVCRQPE
jgi:hypothetical protein